MMAPENEIEGTAKIDAIVLTTGGIACQYGGFVALGKGNIIFALLGFVGMLVALAVLIIEYLRRKNIIWKRELVIE